MAMKWRHYLSTANAKKGLKDCHFENIEDIALKADRGSIASHLDPISPLPAVPTTYSKSSESPSRTVTNEHRWPLQPGWVIGYRDRFGTLRGGFDELQRSTVIECQFNGLTWMVRLSGGEEVDLRSIKSVAKTNDDGAVSAAWTVREHGYDGEKK
jgi:hypothetical protein